MLHICSRNPFTFAAWGLVPVFWPADDNSRWKLIYAQCFLNRVMLMLKRTMQLNFYFLTLEVFFWATFTCLITCLSVLHS